MRTVSALLSTLAPNAHALTGCLVGLSLFWPSGRAAAQSTESICRAVSTSVLPDVARESSGLAKSRTRPGVLWTHNDQGHASELFAIDESGRLLQRVRVPVRAIDWEDIDAAACVGGSCVYVGDIGDNDGDRDTITIYRIAEPAAGATESGGAVALRARYPDGPEDAEALLALPTGDLFIVTKGRKHDIALYRYPAPPRPEQIVVLERVRALFPEPKDNDDRVTAATATPDGRWIGVRTYRTLYLYPATPLLSGAAVRPTVVDLASFDEGQGEGLAMANDGTVWLSSEAENKRSRPQLRTLACAIPRGAE
jgi:hypothetical protein